MRSIRKIFEKNLQIITVIAAAFLAVSTVMSCINVFLRYVMGSSLPWADELSIYIVILMVFLYQCKLEYEDDQLSISVLQEHFKDKPAILKTLYYLRMVITLFLYALLINSGITVVKQHLMYKATTSVMRMPLWILGVVITVGMILVVLYWFVKFLPKEKNADIQKEGANNG